MSATEDTLLIQEGKPLLDDKHSQIIGFAMKLTQWIPFILSMSIENVVLAWSLAFFVACGNICLSFLWYRMGKTRSWPKVLDVIFACMFGILSLIAWGHPNSETFGLWIEPVVDFGLLVGTSLSWIFGHPYVKDFMADEVDEKAITHPIVVHMIRRLSMWWTTGFALMFLSSLIPALMSMHDEGITERVGIAWFWLSMVFTNTLLIVLLLTSYKWYPAWVFKHIDYLASLYPEEVEDWKTTHSDHEWAA